MQLGALLYFALSSGSFILIIQEIIYNIQLIYN